MHGAGAAARGWAAGGKSRRAGSGGGCADREVVDAADAGAELGQVGPVNMQGNRDARAAVADPVDVTGRSEPGHGAGRVLPAGDLGEVLATRAGSEDLLVFGALQNAGDAP